MKDNPITFLLVPKTVTKVTVADVDENVVGLSTFLHNQSSPTVLFCGSDTLTLLSLHKEC